MLWFARLFALEHIRYKENVLRNHCSCPITIQKWNCFCVEQCGNIIIVSAEQETGNHFHGSWPAINHILKSLIHLFREQKENLPKYISRTINKMLFLDWWLFTCLLAFLWYPEFDCAVRQIQFGPDPLHSNPYSVLHISFCFPTSNLHSDSFCPCVPICLCLNKWTKWIFL